VKKAEEESFIEFEKYRAGAGTMLEVVDAEEALTRAKLNLILAEADYVKYQAEVENAMGIGLTDEEQIAARNMEMNIKETKVPKEEKVVRKGMRE
jgi:outer membrane protein TolC